MIIVGVAYLVNGFGLLSKRSQPWISTVPMSCYVLLTTQMFLLVYYMKQKIYKAMLILVY